MAVLIGWFVLIAVVNWEYEQRFFEPVVTHSHSNPWLGLKLLAIGAAFGLASGAFAFMASQQISARKRLKVALSIVVSVICFLMALAFLILGPAELTMIEQMDRMQMGQDGF